MVLVTGVTGNVGKELVELLHAEDAQVAPLPCDRSRILLGISAK